MMPRFIDPISQGFYFSFISLLALQVLVDFGLNQSITQIIAHEHALERYKNINNIKIYVQRWFKYGSILFFILIIPIGLFYFHDGDINNLKKWAITWVVLATGTTLCLYQSYKFAILEGEGKQSIVANFRMYQSLITTGFAMVGMYFGVGVNSIAAIPILNSLISAIWLSSNFEASPEKKLIKNEFEKIANEIFSLRWRIGVSWVCGYLVQQSITTIMFRAFGPVIAGQYGLLMAIFNAISVVGISFAAANAQKFASNIALQKHDDLMAIFKDVLIKSFFGTFALCIFCLIFIVFFDLVPIDRLPPLLPIFLVAFNCLANSIIFTLAIFLRAHKSEPTLKIGLVLVLPQILLMLFAANISPEFLILVYCGMNILVGLPWTIIIWYENYNKNYRLKYEQ